MPKGVYKRDPSKYDFSRLGKHVRTPEIKAKTKVTLYERHGKDFFQKIGHTGGSTKRSKPSGFAYMKLHHPEKFDELAKRGGRKPYTDEQKAAVSERMRAYWVERKKNVVK